MPEMYEVPLSLKKLLSLETIHAAVVLGIVERGETAHAMVMAQAIMPKILEIQLESIKPVGQGILGPEIHPSQIE